MDVNRWLDQLFEKSALKGEPLVCMKISRTQKFKSKEKLTMSSAMWKSFIINARNLVTEKKRNAPCYGIQLGSYRSEKTQGFYLSGIDSLDPDWFRFLADYTIARLKALDYKIVSQQEELFVQNNQHVAWEKHRLKPAFRFHNEKHCQGFGNICIENKFVNNKIKLFKLQANFYSGRASATQKAYSALLADLFVTRS